MAIFTKKEKDTFEQICRLRQPGVLQMMKAFLASKYENIIVTPAYVMAFGDIPVGLVAHADTVFKAPPKQFFYDKEQNTMWSPDGMGADDRAGIFSIIKILNAGLRPHVIITTDEEKGCIGSSKLVGHYKIFPQELKFLIQLDRRGSEDSVYYDCDNKEFEKFINEFGFKTAWGSLSDISVLAPIWKIAAVNFSVGYFNEHTNTEYLCVSDLQATINKTITLLKYVKDHPETPVYEYVDGYKDYFGKTIKMDADTEKYFWENGLVSCSFCNEVDTTENMIPIVLPFNEATGYICNECYSKLYSSIFWCNHCQRGFYLPTLKDKQINDKEWLCDECIKLV